MNKLLYLLLITTCWSCAPSSNTEKRQNERESVVEVREKVREIEIEDVLIGRISRPFIIGEYLLIGDYTSVDKLIHIFDKKNFNYLTSIAPIGQGPGEITNMGHIGVDETHRILYVSDHGKQKIFSYNLDSVFVDQLYMPQVKLKMNERQFPDRYQYINDTLCVGLIIEPIGNNNFKPSVAKWNMSTQEIKLMKYEHPMIEKKRISFAASMENNVYIECYSYYDLMTICSLNGELKYNIYGPNWDSKDSKNSHYRGAVFCKDRILAAYSGESTFTKDKTVGIKPNCPTKFLVFDINGDYIKTLEIGYRIYEFCYDKENNRIIMVLDDDIQFAYLNLNGLIE